MEGERPTTKEDPRACPRCRCALFKGAFGGATLLGCGRCGGVWLDNLACQAVVRGTAQALTALAEQAARAATVTVPELSAACPICSQTLARTTVPSTSVTVDTCAAHGTWFDANELRVVALAYAELPPPMEFDPDEYPLPLRPFTWFETTASDHDRSWGDDPSPVDLGDVVSFVESLFDSNSDSDSSGPASGHHHH